MEKIFEVLDAANRGKNFVDEPAPPLTLDFFTRMTGQMGKTVAAQPGLAEKSLEFFCFDGATVFRGRAGVNFTDGRKGIEQRPARIEKYRFEVFYHINFDFHSLVI